MAGGGCGVDDATGWSRWKPDKHTGVLLNYSTPHLTAIS